MTLEQTFFPQEGKKLEVFVIATGRRRRLKHTRHWRTVQLAS